MQECQHTLEPSGDGIELRRFIWCPSNQKPNLILGKRFERFKCAWLGTRCKDRRISNSRGSTNSFNRATLNVNKISLKKLERRANQYNYNTIYCFYIATNVLDDSLLACECEVCLNYESAQRFYHTITCAVGLTNNTGTF